MEDQLLATLMLMRLVWHSRTISSAISRHKS